MLFTLLLGTPITGSILCAVFHRRRVLEAITVASAGVTFVSALWLMSVVMGQTTVSTPQEWWYADGLSAYMALIVSSSALVVALYSIGYLRRQVLSKKVDDRQLWLYYLLLNVFLFTMMLVLLLEQSGFLVDRVRSDDACHGTSRCVLRA